MNLLGIGVTTKKPCFVLVAVPYSEKERERKKHQNPPNQFKKMLSYFLKMGLKQSNRIQSPQNTEIWNPNLPSNFHYGLH